MAEVRRCLQCGHAFTPMRPHQVFDSQECRYQGWVEKEILAAEETDQRVDAPVHPLAEARARQESSDLKSKLSQIIYQGIVDRLKFGAVHADDLEGLFPEGSRSMCRRLVGAQFGSLASRGYIVERERRKSKVPSRKSAKSGVYEFTRKGREKLVGVTTGLPSPQGTDGPYLPAVGASGDSGEKPATGVSTPQGPSGSDIAPSAPVAEGSGEGPSQAVVSSEPAARLFDDRPLNPLADAEAA